MDTKSDNISKHGDAVLQQHNEEEEEEEIKRKISCHSLYDLLVQTHLDCLKVCLGITDIDKIEKAEEKSSKYNKVLISRTNDHQAELNTKFSSLTMDQPAELDNFMEAYCVALSKLKEAMEEPHLESIKFINHMYSQLSELMELPSSASTPSFDCAIFVNEGERIFILQYHGGTGYTWDEGPWRQMKWWHEEVDRAKISISSQFSIL
ncbi:Fused compound leaf [Datura stramonium]|uniref:Fused compound leaf n=1 Tax=Datura stramonium TaxID=4076 RepID=A0ABS8S3D5_DATST|nr:Fused compound leaf [Datura stramonium]